MKRAVIYVRVSSLEQVQNLSLGTQESICREYCARNEIEVDRVFVEEGESAKTADRTEFQKMLEYCRQNKNRLQFVIVYTVNRFARNNEDHFAVSGYYSCNRYCRGVVIRKEVLEDAFIELIQRSQPKPEMVTLFRQIVLDLWRNKQGERGALTSTLQRQLTLLGERKQRLLDAYIHDRAIDRETYQQQADKLEEELANARLAIAEAKYEDFDIEGVVAFAEQILSQPAKLWSEMSLDQRQRLQRVLFPNGIEITADKQIGTAEICSIFKVLDAFQPESTAGGSVVPLIAASWNQIMTWLRQIDQLRQAAVAQPEAA